MGGLSELCHTMSGILGDELKLQFIRSSIREIRPVQLVYMLMASSAIVKRSVSIPIRPSGCISIRGRMRNSGRCSKVLGKRSTPFLQNSRGVALPIIRAAPVLMTTLSFTPTLSTLTIADHIGKFSQIKILQFLFSWDSCGRIPSSIFVIIIQELFAVRY